MKYLILLFLVQRFIGFLQECEPKVYRNLNYALQYPSEVRILDLSEQNINELDWRIRNLVNLEERDLTHNELTSLPWELGYCKSLLKLDIRATNITSIPQEVLKLPFVLIIR